MAKRLFQLVVIISVLAGAFVPAGSASAWPACPAQITVQWGDTLSGLAVAYGVTMDAIRSANPGLGWWLYAGQVLCIPVGYAPTPPYYPIPVSGQVYVVQRGDTMSNIARRYGLSLSYLLAANPQVWNPSLIYPGQMINLPGYSGVPIPTSAPPPPTPPPYGSQYSTLKVTYKYGLLVRTGPGKNYPEIVSPLVSAVKNTTWRYRTNTLTVDAKGMVWAEVLLPPGVPGYSTGWVIVRDQFGHTYTDPKIDLIDP